MSQENTSATISTLLKEYSEHYSKYEASKAEIATNGWNSDYLGCDEVKGKE